MNEDTYPDKEYLFVLVDKRNKNPEQKDTIDKSIIENFQKQIFSNFH